MTSRHEDSKDRRRDERFVQDVLARTSGSPCEKAHTMLPELVDGELESMDRQLVQAHLEHCTGCRSLAVTLGWVGPELHGLAEIDPGPAFTDSVLARTSRKPEMVLRNDTAPSGLAGVMDRVGRWWEKQILKPDFPVQAAYAATVILVLLFAVPWSPFKEVPGKALAVVQARPAEVPLIGGTLQSASNWVDSGTSRVAGTVRGGLSTRWQAVESSLDYRAGRTQASRTDLQNHLDGMVDRFRAGETGPAGYEFLEALKASQQVWIEWWNIQDDDKGE